MQPYQEASEEIKNQAELPGKAASSLARSATGFVGGGAILNRISPLLNKLVPSELSVKGLEKVDPRFGKFIKGAMQAGHTAEEAINFIKEKSEPEQKEPPKEDRNIIEQYSPELNQFLKQEIGNGRSPVEAGALAQIGKGDPSFIKIIKKMEEDHKTPFSQILQSIYGQGEAQQQPQSKAVLQSQQQMGPGAQDLLNTVNELVQLRGK